MPGTHELQHMTWQHTASICHCWVTCCSNQRVPTPPHTLQVEKQTIVRPKGQYLGGVPLVAWAQVQKDKTQFSFQGEARGLEGGLQFWEEGGSGFPGRAAGWGGWGLVLGASAGLEAACPACPRLGANQHTPSHDTLQRHLVLTHARRPPPPHAGETEGSYHHSSKWVSTASCNVQTIGRDVLYTPRLETRLKTGRRNKVAIGALFSRLGEDYSHPFNVSCSGAGGGWGKGAQAGQRGCPGGAAGQQGHASLPAATLLCCPQSTRLTAALALARALWCSVARWLTA